MQAFSERGGVLPVSRVERGDDICKSLGHWLNVQLYLLL